jgi:DNA-binding response OmpR family regulator
MGLRFHQGRDSMPQIAKNHILIVDDDASIRELLRDSLEMEGFIVSEAADSAGMQAVLKRVPVDLVTLDLMLGRENGLHLAKTVKDQHDIPIIMITGKGDTIDKVVGLEIGADDYIAKPFHPREVVARVRAVLRRNAPKPKADAANSEILAFDGYVLNLGKRELLRSINAQAVPLTTAEFDLLVVLALRPQRVLSRDTLMDLLKGHEWTPFDRSIDALVSRLRRKVEKDPANPDLIKTVRGIGYLFAGTADA